MARLNVWDEQFKRPEAKPVTRTLKAADGPELTLTLRQMGALEAAAASDKAREYAETYLEGDAPVALVFPGGKTPQLSRLMLANAATLEQMQVPEEGEAPYSLIEWLGIADRLPALWGQILRFSNEVQNPKSQSGNDGTPATGE